MRDMLKKTPALVATLMALVVSFAPLANDRIIVVASDTSIGAISKWQLRQIYLENGVNHKLKPINLPIGAVERAVFNTHVIGLTESRIRSYWTQRKFTGRGTPPKELKSVEAIIEYLKQHPGYVAYLPEGTELTESIRVVHRIAY